MTSQLKKGRSLSLILFITAPFFGLLPAPNLPARQAFFQVRKQVEPFNAFSVTLTAPRHKIMQRHKIYQEDGSSYTTTIMGDYEYIDPVPYFSKSYIQHQVSVMKDILALNQETFKQFPQNVVEKGLYKKALADWNEHLKEIQECTFPENLISILSSQTKKEQTKLLKDLSLTRHQFMAFLFKACSDFGYTLSNYHAEHHHNGLSKSDLPLLAEVVNGEVKKVGPTSLTDGQLKQAVKDRKVTIAKFLDKGTDWHCFFLTYRSIRGEETWNNGQPHYHYISDKFGLTRAKVIEELKSRDYNLNSLPHIGIKD